MSDDFSLQYVTKATYLAKINNNEFVTPEHILMCLLENKEFTYALEDLGVDTTKLTDDLYVYFNETKDSSLIGEIWTPDYSSGLINAIDSLEQFVLDENKNITDIQIFESLALSNTQWISYCFAKQGFDLLDVIHNLRDYNIKDNGDSKDSVPDDKSEDAEIRDYIAKSLAAITGQEVNPDDIQSITVEEAKNFNMDDKGGVFLIDAPIEVFTPNRGNPYNNVKFPFGQAGPMMFSQPKIDGDSSNGMGEPKKNPFITNLSENHCKDKIHYIGREDTIDKCVDTLCRLDKNNLIITGEPGVGKSSFIYGIIDKVEKMSTSDARYDRVSEFTFLQLNIKALIAGSKYRGELEERIMQILSNITKTYKSPVVFMDEFQDAFYGQKGAGEVGILGYLKDYLTSSKIRFIASCSSSSYMMYMETDSEINRRFKQIKLEEPSIEECIKILKGIKGSYENYHNVKYTKAALECAVKSSKKYIKDRFLPDKAIDIIDEAGVYCLKNKKTSVTPEMIEKVISMRCSIPLENISKTDIEKVKQMEEVVNNKVFGQEEAVKKLVKHIKINKAGLNEDNKPIGSFLFVGPTGVGKTEVARTLAETLGVELIKFDMSEYSEKHSITKLTGSPPSFVGYEEGSLLVSAVKQSPDCVLLLDEIEKAHPDIYNILLQIMDDAVLTDSKGIKAYFNNVVLIMTSNCGAQEASKNGIGFTSTTKKDEIIKHINESFAPEFRGRLTDIIEFNSINEAMAEKIVIKFIGNLADKLKDRKMTLELSKDANNYIMNKGYDSTKGARGIKDIIDNELKTIISEEIVSGNASSGSKLHIVFNGESLVCKAS